MNAQDCGLSNEEFFGGTPDDIDTRPVHYPYCCHRAELDCDGEDEPTYWRCTSCGHIWRFQGQE